MDHNQLLLIVAQLCHLTLLLPDQKHIAYGYDCHGCKHRPFVAVTITAVLIVQLDNAQSYCTRSARANLTLLVVYV